jgi:hypothetical protein
MQTAGDFVLAYQSRREVDRYPLLQGSLQSYPADIYRQRSASEVRKRQTMMGEEFRPPIDVDAAALLAVRSGALYLTAHVGGAPRISPRRVRRKNARPDSRDAARIGAARGGRSRERLAR